MAIQKHLVANVGDNGQLYFVSGADRFDGIYVNGDKQTPVAFMSFITSNGDVTPIMENSYQKFLWSMDVENPEWQKEFMIHIPSGETKNPYNKKVSIALQSIETTAAKHFSKR